MTPTVASAGTATNVVPARAVLDVDVRATTIEEQERVDGEIRALAATVDGAVIRVEGSPNRPPLERASSWALYETACRLADEMGLGALSWREVGGGSDGNFTAGAAVPTLDGLGAVGGNAHAEGEYVDLASMPERAALVAALVADLLAP